jgi:hypothetical protein
MKNRENSNYVITAWTGVILVAFGATLATGQVSASKMDDALDASRQQVRRGKPEVAIQLLKDEIRARPALTIRLTCEMGSIYKQSGDLRNSYAVYRSVLDLNPKQFGSSAVSTGLLHARLVDLAYSMNEVRHVSELVTNFAARQKSASTAFGSKIAVTDFSGTGDILAHFGTKLGEVGDIAGRNKLYRNALRIGVSQRVLVDMTQYFLGSGETIMANKVIATLKTTDKILLLRAKELKRVLGLISPERGEQSVEFQQKRAIQKMSSHRESTKRLLGI